MAELEAVLPMALMAAGFVAVAVGVYRYAKRESQAEDERSRPPE